MHFSIPDIKEYITDSGETYTGYNIHINGFYHCTTRYKQLLSLHEQLLAQYPYVGVPAFPPKKLFLLTQSQIDERRLQLEKYLQLIGQNPKISSSDLLTAFLITAQQETHNVRTHVVDVEVSLMDCTRIPLTISSIDTSDSVLDIVCNHLDLSKELMKYFSLFLFNWSCAKNGQPCMKKLEPFESPYISQKYVCPEDKIMLRKCYWDPTYDVDLMIDRAALDLLYTQVMAEIELGWLSIDGNSKERLTTHESNKQKREYLELVRTLKHYGRIPAGEAIAEGANVSGFFGEEACRVKISLACRELVLSTHSKPPKEERFKVTRMRCWRITTLHPLEKSHNNGYDEATIAFQEATKNLELSFEYLITKNRLRWVTLKTEHATYISVCLQAIVDELMQQKNGLPSHKPSRKALTYLTRDGSNRIITPSSSTDTLSSGVSDSFASGNGNETFSIQKLAESFASVAFKSGRDYVENDAFEGIKHD